MKIIIKKYKKNAENESLQLTKIQLSPKSFSQCLKNII